MNYSFQIEVDGRVEDILGLESDLAYLLGRVIYTGFRAFDLYDDFRFRGEQLEALIAVLAGELARLEGEHEQIVLSEVRRYELPEWARPMLEARMARDPVAPTLAELLALATRAHARGATLAYSGP